MKDDRPLDPNLCSNTPPMSDLFGEPDRVITLDSLAHLDLAPGAIQGNTAEGMENYVPLTRTLYHDEYGVLPWTQVFPADPPRRSGHSPGTMQRRRRQLRRRLGW